MRKVIGRNILFLAVLAVQACIRNDIPYPVVELSITSISGEGFTCSASDINAADRTAVIHLDEATDIRSVVISEVVYTDGATSDVVFPGVFDMRSDLKVSLDLYQTYEWTDFTEEWTLSVETTDILASVNSAAAGTRVMWLEGSAAPDTEVGFRYRTSAAEDWTEVADADLVVPLERNKQLDAPMPVQRRPDVSP